jgi:predicted dehydrogenase
MDPVRLGVLGCGDIAPVYLHSLRHFQHVRCIRLADVNTARARMLGHQWGIARTGGPAELLADPDVELVLNLTPPRAHYATALQALAAGKHIYNEKPLADSPARGRRVLAAARRRGLRVGCAPATWMGGTWQTCRELIDAGVLGRPVGANLIWLDRGYETWHPRPRSYYQPGAGPMFDIGPYYIAALVLLFGAVQRVSAFTSTTFAEREIGTGRHRGTHFTVGVPDHVAGVVEMANGVLTTITTSYASRPAPTDSVQLFGSEATLVLPPANHLGGPIWMSDASTHSWRRLTVQHGRTHQRRWWAVGVAEMSAALRAGRPHRASGELGLHVLDVLDGLVSSALDGSARRVRSKPGRPDPLQFGISRNGQLASGADRGGGGVRTVTRGDES